MADVVGDPALHYIGEFLQAGVNLLCADDWDLVCPSDDPGLRLPVTAVFQHDPKEFFDDTHLPSLHVWREKAAGARVGDDLYRDTFDIHVGWVMEGAQEETRQSRLAMMRKISDTIYQLVNKDRVPVWRRPEDTDAFSMRHGSSLSSACGYSRMLKMNVDDREIIYQAFEDAKPQPFTGFETIIECDSYPETLQLVERVPAKLNADLLLEGSLAITVREDVA